LFFKFIKPFSICSATPLVAGWGPGFCGLRGFKRIFGGLPATFSDKNGFLPPPAGVYAPVVLLKMEVMDGMFGFYLTSG
jgi:hypothetical protein